MINQGLFPMHSTNMDAFASKRARFIGPLLGGRPAWLRYGSALVLTLTAALIRLALVPALGSGSPLLPFYSIVLLVVILAGRGPAVLAALTSVPCAVVITLTGYDQILSLGWAVHFGFFLITCAFTIAIADIAQRSHAEQRQLLHNTRLSEQLAQKAVEQMRLIADAMPVLIGYIDHTYKYRFNNRQYETWFGRPAHEWTGRHAREVLGEAAFAAVLPHLQRALAGENVHFEAAVPYHDAGDRHISAHYVPDRDTDGTVRGVFVLIEDISERKHAADALEHALQQLSLAQRVGRIGTFEWDIRSNTNRWSDELLALHGLAPGEFGGTHEAWLASIHPEDRQRMIEQTVRTLQEGMVVVEYRVVRHDTGEVRWMQGRGKVYYDDEGTPIRVLGANIDITERIEAETALRREARRKDEFLAMLAHELRNPLAPIRSAAPLLRQCAHDPERIRGIGDMVDRQSALLTRMVDDLLDVARITRGLIELHRSVLSIEVPIEAALESIKPFIDRKQQNIDFIRPPSTSFVEADGARLSQVFSNLLVNASKYSPEHSRIQLLIEQDAEQVIVRVVDSGDGIDAQLLPQVFDLFTQGERSLARPQGGLGLGLTLVKHLVTMHGGTVEAHSHGRGTGSEFVVKLRRALAQGPLPQPAAPSAVASGSDIPKQRVMIVDDNADAARMLAMVLEIDGHEVRTAGDGHSALQMFDEFPAALVLLDVGLPDISGYEVARGLRERQTAPVQIYALTGYGSPEDIDRALQHGFDGHLTKPCNTDRILDLLSKCAAAT